VLGIRSDNTSDYSSVNTVAALPLVHVATTGACSKLLHVLRTAVALHSAMLCTMSSCNVPVRPYILQ
jgi:hypothetical protein